MLTEQQKIDFVKAVAVWNRPSLEWADCVDENKGYDFAKLCEVENVAATRDTLADFLSGAARTAKRHEQQRTPAGVLHIFHEVQARKGARRGTAFVMDFVEARAAFFNVEV